MSSEGEAAPLETFTAKRRRQPRSVNVGATCNGSNVRLPGPGDTLWTV